MKEYTVTLKQLAVAKCEVNVLALSKEDALTEARRNVEGQNWSLGWLHFETPVQATKVHSKDFAEYEDFDYDEDFFV
jgi:hypothetical protein